MKLAVRKPMGRLSLAELAKAPSAHAKRLRASGHAALLTHGRKSDLVVLDLAAYQSLLIRLEEAETKRGLRQSVRDMRAGRVRPAATAISELIEDVRAGRV